MKALLCLSILLCLHSVLPTAIRVLRDSSGTISKINAIREKIGMQPLKENADLAAELEKLDVCAKETPKSKNWRLAPTDGDENASLLVLFVFHVFIELVKRGRMKEVDDLFGKDPGPLDIFVSGQTQVACRRVECVDSLTDVWTEEDVKKLNELFQLLYHKQLQGDKVKTTEVCLFGPMGSESVLETKQIEKLSVAASKKVETSGVDKTKMAESSAKMERMANEFASGKMGNKLAGGKTSGSAYNSHTILSFVMALLVFLF